jgi:hypothetical protein
LRFLQVVKTTFGGCKFQDLRKSFCNESGLKKDDNKLQHCVCEKNTGRIFRRPTRNFTVGFCIEENEWQKNPMQQAGFIVFLGLKTHTCYHF